MSVLLARMSVYCVPVWCLWRPLEVTRSLGTQLWVVMSCHGVSGTKCGSSVRAANKLP